MNTVTTPFDRLYNSSGGNSRGGSGFSVKFLSMPKNLAGHWYQVLPGNLWSTLADFQQYHNRGNHTARLNRLNLSRHNRHFRSFSGRTRLQLALADRISELLITVLFPIASCLVPANYLLLALSPKSDSNFSSLYFRPHEVWPMAVFSVDAAAFFLVFQTIYKRLLLYYKTLPIICLAWYLHSQEVLKAAVRQMRAAEHAFFRSSNIGLANAPSKKLKNGNTSYWHYLVGTISGANSRTMSPDSQRLSAAISTIWVSVFMREHCRLLVDLVHLNRHLVSPLLFWFYSPVLVSSVYILCLLYFMPVATLLKLYLLAVFIFVPITFALLFFLSVVVQTLYDHQADSGLFRGQMLCRGSSADLGGGNGNSTFLRTKLKLMSYYEVLRTEKKVTFSFGSYAKVDHRWLFEVKANKGVFSVFSLI